LWFFLFGVLKVCWFDFIKISSAGHLIGIAVDDIVDGILKLFELETKLCDSYLTGIGGRSL